MYVGASKKYICHTVQCVFLCFTENSLPKPKLPEDSVISPYNINTSYPGLATGNGLSDSPAGSKDHGNVPIIVPLIPPPFIKPPAGKSS